MPGRDEIDDAFTRHPAVGSEPREQAVHPHRATFQGVPAEARMWLKAALLRNAPKKFMVYARPRSGTTLLGDLIGQVSGIEVRGEMMHYRLLAPRALLRIGPMRSPAPVFGFKLLSYQLMEVQQIHRPLAFFDRALAQGYQLIHLRRDTWSQTLSLVKAQAGGRYFDTGGDAGPTEIEIAPEAFLASYAWNARMLAYEDEVMAHLPHMTLQYEEGLRSAEAHQATVDRVCAALDHPAGPVVATRTRTGGARGSVRVRNMDAVTAAAREAGIDLPESAT